MNKLNISLSSKYFYIALLLLPALSCRSMDLLEQPALISHLASKSMVMSLTKSKNTVLAVGERGHIIQWTNSTNWQQKISPVSVTLTDIIELNDGSKIAVGHDGVILKTNAIKNTATKASQPNWHKVFTGTEILELQIAQMKKKLQALQTSIAETVDEDLKDELNYTLEDLTFAIEDAQSDLTSGPNKPLLSITKTTNDILFACGAYGILLTSTDHGETWQMINERIENTENFHLNTITSTDDDQLYMVGENGIAFKSVDLGKTWTTMTMPYTGSLFGIVANNKQTPVGTHTELAAFGLQGNIMVSLDNGTTWQHKKLASGTSLLGGNFSDAGEVFLVGHGGIIVKFSPEKLAELSITKHSSGAAFSDVLIRDNELILAGQFGITTYSLTQ